MHFNEVHTIQKTKDEISYLKEQLLKNGELNNNQIVSLSNIKEWIESSINYNNK